MNNSLPQLLVEGDVIRLRGRWTAEHLDRIDAYLRHKQPWSAAQLAFDFAGVESLDTAGAWLIQRLFSDLRKRGKTVLPQGASEQVSAMLTLVAAQTDPRELITTRRDFGLLEKIGRESLDHLKIGYEFLSFVGASTITALRAFASPRRLRPRAVLKTIEQAGVNALPIIGLLSFLIGIVIGYQSATFLAQYGANLYIADLVGISMARELAPLMTAIIVAGRTGSAFTAQIGTMVVTDEIDALRAMGIRPLEVLVVPKVFGLIIVLPLLTLFADVFGVFGGIVIGNAILDVSASAFLDRLAQQVSVSSYLVGLAKAAVFAVVIAAVGCYQGFKVQGSAESVGQRTTMSVVQSIFLVIIIDAVFSVLFNWLDI